MIRGLVGCVVAVVGFAGADREPDADVREAYRDAKASAGRGADAQVRLALWCEAHGLEVERIRHLAVAVMTDPSHVTARGLLGLVEYRGKWARPDDVAARVKSDAETSAALAEYNARRAKLRNRADDHYELALWCEAHGLKPEATAHFTNVTRLDPARESAWKHLGFRKYNGTWMSDTQAGAAKGEAEARKQADRRWRPLLERWRGWLDDKVRRPEAEAHFAEVTDPRALPAIWAVFGLGTAAQQRVAVRLFGQIDGAAASRALVGLAVRGKSPEVRHVAAAVVARRDPREFLDLLIDQLRRPLKYEVKPVGGPGSPGVLFVEGERYNVRRIYATPTNPLVPSIPNRLFADSIPYDPVASGQAAMVGPFAIGPGATAIGSTNPTGHAGHGAQDAASATVAFSTGAALRRDAQIARSLQTNFQIAQQETAVAQAQLRADIAAVEAMNADIREIDDSVVPLLKDTSGEDFGDDPKSWRRWWTDRKGYALMTDDGPEIKPTYTEVVALPDIRPVPPRTACFGAGTPVRTLDGLRAIEAIRAGDRVLAQDPKTGALSFRPVVAVYHNPPSATLAVKFADEAVVATGIHRFWKAGRGWVMARDLKAGDEVRTLGGKAKVVAVEPETVQRVYNLEVAGGHSFLVGRAGMLVHDNSLVEPTPAPFDAAPALVAKSAAAAE